MTGEVLLIFFFNSTGWKEPTTSLGKKIQKNSQKADIKNLEQDEVILLFALYFRTMKFRIKIVFSEAYLISLCQDNSLSFLAYKTMFNKDSLDKKQKKLSLKMINFHIMYLH